ncbi:MAG: DUF1232 domain-containing protein [Bacteroidales bacterium]|nr:DUF1232 domain-containing protein [Bacteroidales bacterium]
MTGKEFSTHNASGFKKYFSESSFWSKLKKEAAKAGATVLYVALMLYYVMTARQVPIKDKALILGALGYLILPTDLIPDLLPAIGYSDDLTALITVFNIVKKNIDDNIRQQAQDKVRELLGDVSQDSFQLPML